MSDLLNTYCGASGQRVNHEKYYIFFSKGCPQNQRQDVKNSLYVHNESLSERYLGMPTEVGHSINGTFRYLRDRVWEKIRGWMEKLLSAAVCWQRMVNQISGPSYPGVFYVMLQITTRPFENVTSIICEFWWGSKQGKRKPSWVSWENMTRPKNLGDLGYCNLEIFNFSLLS